MVVFVALLLLILLCPHATETELMLLSSSAGRREKWVLGIIHREGGTQVWVGILGGLGHAEGFRELQGI